VIVIIAVFYTSTLNMAALALALVAFAAWAALQRLRVSSPLVYVR
jgi:Na+/H+ antiporter NhaA